ncbi:MAG: lysophospholipid acyltransferase family protein [Anaerolineales bacterium]|nr:lysophospholipid acyltransferase family protein [Anaerolineales bacterium]
MQTAPSSLPKPPNYRVGAALSSSKGAAHGDKPVSEVWRPELTRLPRLTWGRRLFRGFIRALARCLVFAGSKATVSGLENFPKKGPALVVINHLGDADGVLGLAFWPAFTDALAKIELFDLPVLGWIIDTLGVIWVHRGRPDKRALSAALDGLQSGRIIMIAPEARESVIGALEEGTRGAAFLALKANVPIVPVTVTGTENERIYGNLKRLRRTPVTLRVGKPFVLPKLALSRSPERSEGSAEGQANRHEALRQATRLIMEALAGQLPPEYRGVYNYVDRVGAAQGKDV